MTTEGPQDQEEVSHVKIFLTLGKDSRILVELKDDQKIIDLGRRQKVIFHVAAADRRITSCSIQCLLLFEPDTSLPSLQKGALVGSWSLLKGTQGITTTLSGIYLTIPTTNSPDKITVINGDVSDVGQTCFVTLMGLAQIEEGKVFTWFLDPELVLQSGGPCWP